MIKLKQVKFYGFQDEQRNAVLNFSDDSNVTIIYGDNGCGKTTFLKLLNAVFKRDNKMLLENNINKIYISYLVNNKIKSISIEKINKEEKIMNLLKKRNEEDFIKHLFNSKNEKNKSIIKYLINNNNELPFFDDYSWDDFSNSELQDSKSLSLGIDRGSNWISTKSFSSIDLKDFILRNRKYRTIWEKLNVEDFSEEFNAYIRHRTRLNKRNNEIDFESNHIYLPKIELEQIANLLLEKYRLARNETTNRIQNALFETLSDLIDHKSLKNYDDALRTIDEISNNHYKERIIDALSSISDSPLKTKVINLLNNEEKLKENDIIQALIHNMVSELRKEEKSLLSINSFVSEFNTHLSGGKELKLNFDSISVQIREKSYDLGVLSSGEKHIFTLLALVNLLGSSRDFLIIDEPEISLNVNWKRNLISLLIKILPNTQIIVASHSISIASNFTSSLKNIESFEE